MTHPIFHKEIFVETAFEKRTLEPYGGVLRFKSHDKRKTNTPNIGQRWARGETNWDVIGS